MEKGKDTEEKKEENIKTTGSEKEVSWKENEIRYQTDEERKKRERKKRNEKRRVG